MSEDFQRFEDVLFGVVVGDADEVLILPEGDGGLGQLLFFAEELALLEAEGFFVGEGAAGQMSGSGGEGEQSGVNVLGGSFPGNCMITGQGADAGSAELLDVAAYPKGLSEVTGDAADVSAFAAAYFEFEPRVFIALQNDFVDGYGAGLQLDLFTATSFGVGTDAIDFGGAECRWGLLDFSQELVKGLLNGDLIGWLGRFL